MDSNGNPGISDGAGGGEGRGERDRHPRPPFGWGRRGGAQVWSLCGILSRSQLRNVMIIVHFWGQPSCSIATPLPLTAREMEYSCSMERTTEIRDIWFPSQSFATSFGWTFVVFYSCGSRLCFKAASARSRVRLRKNSLREPFCIVWRGFLSVQHGKAQRFAGERDDYCRWGVVCSRWCLPRDRTFIAFHCPPSLCLAAGLLVVCGAICVSRRREICEVLGMVHE